MQLRHRSGEMWPRLGIRYCLSVPIWTLLEKVHVNLRIQFQHWNIIFWSGLSWPEVLHYHEPTKWPGGSENRTCPSDLRFLGFHFTFFLAWVWRNSSLCIEWDIDFRLFITKNVESSACQEDHVAAIIDFVTIGLVVVLCLVHSQLAPWSVRP